MPARLAFAASLFLLLGALVSPAPLAGQTRLLGRFCGRVPIPALRGDYPNPADLNPDEENCGDGEDGDLDGLVDYNEDSDCWGDLGPQDLFLKLPFDVVQPIGDSTPARFTGFDRNFDQVGEILINTTGPGGRKLSYLRTDDPNVYDDVTVEALILPGLSGDNGGPVAIRIQPPDGPNPGMSYFVKSVPGNSVSIEKQLGNGSTVELASATDWDSGDAIDIADFDGVGSVCYQVIFTAAGTSLTATISEVPCDLRAAWTGALEPMNGHTVTLTASDQDLSRGYVGLRSDNDPGEDTLDDNLSSGIDPSVLHYVISDPAADADPDAPRIAFFNSYSNGLDDFDYSTTPITGTHQRPYRRAGSVVADTSLASYLRSLGFRVDEFHIGSFSAGLITPEEINDEYDLFWLPSSGASSSTRGFFRAITIPVVYAEHVDGKSEFAGIYAGNSGNERVVDCGDGTTLSTVSMHVLTEEEGGEPDHPIIAGLADEDGNITVHDTSQIPLNAAYAFPGEGKAGLTGAGFKSIKEILDERGWGPGAPETQFAGYPVTEGAVALAAMNNPCTGAPFWQLDDDGNLATGDGKGHIHLVAVEAGAPRMLDVPEDCPEPCEFDSRVVFYWLSDPMFPYSTPETLAILRRSALWVLGLIDGTARGDLPFKRGDTNGDGRLDLSDAIAIFNFLFAGGAEPGCQDAADSNDDEKVDISDGVNILNFLFLGADPPGPPFINCFQGCGLDFTTGGGDTNLSCNSYESCRS